ncbi:MAG TPA: chemotaxis protein CheW [Ignavibacteriaceae bacterium]|nr:chemotaxis protein CheW [Ignavibacteriaceae bacterium]
MHPKYNVIESFTGLLIFEISGREYCLNYSIVASMLRPPFEIINNCGEDNQGYSIITLKNGTVPLINLKELLKQRGSGRIEKKDSRVIIIENHNEHFGLLVEKIKEVFALDPKYITTSVKFNPETDLPDKFVGNNFSEGFLEIEGRSLQLLNIEKLIDTVQIFNKEAEDTHF